MGQTKVIMKEKCKLYTQRVIPDNNNTKQRLRAIKASETFIYKTDNPLLTLLQGWHLRPYFLRLTSLATIWYLLRYCSHSAWLLNRNFFKGLSKVDDGDVSKVTVFGEGVRVRILALMSSRVHLLQHYEQVRSHTDDSISRSIARGRQ